MAGSDLSNGFPIGVGNDGLGFPIGVGNDGTGFQIEPGNEGPPVRVCNTGLYLSSSQFTGITEA